MKTSIKSFLLLLGIFLVSTEMKSQVNSHLDTAAQHKKERDSLIRARSRAPKKDTMARDKTKVNPRIRKDSSGVKKGLPPKNESAFSPLQDEYERIKFLLPGKNSPGQFGNFCF
jgi:hypothetical protein